VWTMQMCFRITCVASLMTKHYLPRQCWPRLGGASKTGRRIWSLDLSFEANNLFFYFFYFLFSPRFLSWPLKFSKNLFNLFFFFNLVPFFFISICFISDDFLNWNFYLVSSPLNFFICEIWTPIFWIFFFNLRSFFKLNIFLNWISF
jgi:hypothetical protein